MDTISCPRCGADNRADSLNCAACRINLQFAREHPSVIERLRQEDASRKHSEAVGPAGGPAVAPVSKEAPMLLPVLLLLGAFVFAFCLGEAVHEVGHFLCHRAYGVNVGIRLDPFGGSMILHGSSAPRQIWGITSLAGPLLNLLAGLSLTLSLWRVRRPVLLPLLLWGPTAMIQEGVTFSLGMLTPGGDAELIVRWGVPAAVLLSMGALLLASGIAMICCLLPLVGLSPADSFGRKLGVVAGGMVSFMVLRLLASSLRSPHLLVENTVPLVFSLLLATIVAALYGPLYAVLRRATRTGNVPITWPTAAWSIALGVGIVVFQLVALN